MGYWKKDVGDLHFIVLVNKEKRYRVLVSKEDLDIATKYSWQISTGTHKYAFRMETQGKRNLHIRMHREIGARIFPHAPIFDHVNGDNLDNRRENIRPADLFKNAQNARKTKKKTSSKYKGVYQRKRAKPWVAQISAYGAYYNLGSFITEEEAARAYDQKAKELHGEFARTNFED